MNTTETLKELLKLAHESMVSKDIEIAELEKTLRDIEHAVRNENELLEMQKNQDIRDLEQQIGAISDYSESLLNNLNAYSVDDVNAFEESYINALRNQAKALKEQD
jgi:hypothetical protein